MSHYAGVDVGGTKVLCVVLDIEGKTVAQHKVKVGEDKSVVSVLAKVREAYAGALAAAGLAGVAGVGLAVPGPVDSATTTVHKCVNLGWFAPVSLASLGEDLAGKPFVWLDNDANMGAYGEVALGAGKGTRSCYAMFAGTGLGGGYVLDGELVQGVGGNCGEIGHTCVDLRRKKAQLCGCGKRGCLETFGSKSGLLGYLRLQCPAPGPATASLDVLAPSWRTEMVGSKQLKKAARMDAVVDKAIKRAADALGAAAANVLTTTGCEAVIVGGGMVEELAGMWPRIIEAVHEHSFAGAALAPLVRKTVLGDLAVAVGAAAYCSRQHLARAAK